MGLKALQDELARLSAICIDTPVFAYHLAEHPRYVACTSAILEAVEQGRLQGIITTITLTELLTYPAQKGDLDTMREWELYLTNFPNLLLAPLDQALAREAAAVRGETRLKTPDAIQVAAARLRGADALITNDRPWDKRVRSPRVLILDDFADES
jgi:predicted nucleic acid-binding protein